MIQLQIRLTIGFDGSFFLYATMPKSLREARYSDHVWIYRHELDHDKNGILTIKKTTITLMVLNEHYEYILKEFDEIASKHWIAISKTYLKPYS